MPHTLGQHKVIGTNDCPIKYGKIFHEVLQDDESFVLKYLVFMEFLLKTTNIHEIQSSPCRISCQFFTVNCH